MRVRTGVFILSAFMLISACGSGGWLMDSPDLRSGSVFLEDVSGAMISLPEGRLNVVVRNEIKTSVADSIGRQALERMLASYRQAGLAGLQVAEERPDGDYVLKVESIEIRRVATLNFAHWGPNFRVRVNVVGFQGEREVFRTSESANANLAYVASDGRRFYKATDEDKDNPELQRETIYPAMNQAFGKAWEKFLRAGVRH